MNSHLSRVNGWIRFNQFELLQIASVGEIISYIKDMFLEAERRRNQFGLLARDVGMVGGYDVRFISPFAPYRDEFAQEKNILFSFIQEGYISSNRSYLAVIQYQNKDAMGLYLPILEPRNFMEQD